MDYIERFTKRGNALKGAFYIDTEAKAQHRNASNLFVDVLVDIALRAKIAGKDLTELVEEANQIADQEWYFAEPAIREAMKPKVAS